MKFVEQTEDKKFTCKMDAMMQEAAYIVLLRSVDLVFVSEDADTSYSSGH